MTQRILAIAFAIGVGAAACGDNQGTERAVVGDVISRSDPASATECPGGGTVVSSGIDANANHVLDDAEVADREVVCTAAGSATVLALIDEPVGAHCPAGGTAIESGHDANGNHALDPSEIEHVEYACGDVLLTRTADEPKGANCVAGGVALLAGRDRDHDGTLADSEVESRQYACGNVFDGDVAIDESSDIAAYRSIVAITGRLTVHLKGTSIQLMQLVHVGGDLTFSADSIETLALPQLVDVGSTVRIGGGTPQLPLLRHVGALDLSSSRLADLGAFAALRQIDRDVSVRDSHLVDAELHLTSAGDVTVFDNAQLARLSIAATGSLGSVNVSDNAKLTSTRITAGPTVGLVSLYGNAQLAHVTVGADRLDQLLLNLNPAVTDVAIALSHATGDIDLFDITTPFTLALSSVNNVIDVGGLTISGPLTSFTSTAGLESRGQVTFDATQLTSIDHILSARGGISGGLRLSDNARLVRVAPLVVDGSVQVIHNAQLRTIDFLDQDDLNGGLLIQSNDVLATAPSLAKLRQIHFTTTITNNPKLDGLFSPLLEVAGIAVDIENNASLRALQLPNLTGSMNQLDVNFNAALQQLELPRLTSVETLNVETNGQLHHLDLTALTSSDLVEIAGNPHLPTCEVLDVFSHVGGLHLQSGNDNAATCTP